MSLFDWFADRQKNAPIVRASQEPEEGDGLWNKCPDCALVVYRKDLVANASVCKGCGYHHRIDSDERIRLIADAGSFEALDSDLAPTDPLAFKDRRSYADRIRDSQQSTGLRDAVITGFCRTNGVPLALGVMDFRFMGGSMGVVTGEKVAHVFDQALQKKIPALVISCSGGARMQEGILSLMQMAKTSGARQKLKDAGIPYISVLTDPTTGGCAASFAMLGDLNIAEPKALIGFAGPRVIEQSKFVFLI
jgi:acetyl-CoA carboxylase carboxyl transferase subunit beta